MTTVPEIEAAIERLSAEELRQVAEWFDEYQATVNASAATFAQYDAEEVSSDQWIESR